MAGGWPLALDVVLARIGATLVPIALFSVGLQLRLNFGRGQLRAIASAWAGNSCSRRWQCVAMGVAFGATGMVLTIGVLQSAMAPMISAAILADQNGLEPKLANTVLGAGILLSFLTVPLADHLLRT